jgi:UDP-glucose:glycoprotein glucosyltransferase
MAVSTVIFAVTFLFCSYFGTAINSKPVTVALNSKWKSTSLLGEISEYLSKEDGSLFWRFAEDTLDFHWRFTSDRGVYEGALEVVKQNVQPFIFELMKPSLVLRERSAVIEMYQQIALNVLSKHKKECSTFVSVGSSLVCDSSELTTSLLSSSDSVSTVYSFDHVFPPLTPSGDPSHSPPVVILYGQLGTRDFQTFHGILKPLAEKSQIQYIFRHYQSGPSVRTRFSGYGVRLDIKSTEYKAVDDRTVSEEKSKQAVDVDEEIEGFRFSRLQELYPELHSQLNDLREYLKEGSKALAPLKQWQLQDLGFQAVQRVMSSSNESRLHTIRDLAQNLPLLARSLSKTMVSKELRTEIKRNQKLLEEVGISPGGSHLLINGIILDSDDVNAFKFLDLLKTESLALQQLSSLKIKIEDAEELMLTSVKSAHKKYLVDMRHEDVVYINNLEVDMAYRRWAKSITDLLRPSFPGMLRQVAKNIFTLVVCFDPLSEEGEQLLQYVKLFMDHIVPIRFGLLPVDEGSGDTELRKNIIQAFYYVAKDRGSRDAFDWIMELVAEEDITMATVRDTLDNFGVEVVEEIFQNGTPHDQRRKDGTAFFKSKGLGAAPQLLLNGEPLDPDMDIETAIVGAYHSQLPEIQQDVYRSRLTDAMSCYDYVLSKPHVLQRLNTYVTAKDSKQVDLSHSSDFAVQSTPWRDAGDLSSKEITSKLVDTLAYMNDDVGEIKSLSLWLVVDLTGETGLNLLKEAVEYLGTTNTTRLAIVHNPSPNAPSDVPVKFEMGMQLRNPLSVIQHLLLGDSSDVPTKDSKVKETGEVVKGHQKFVQNVLGLSPGQNAILSSGRLVGPFGEEDKFVAEDFTTLEMYELGHYGNSLLPHISDLELVDMNPDFDTTSHRSDLMMRVASLLRSLPDQRRVKIPRVAQEHSVVHFSTCEGSEVCIKVESYLNPLSSEAQIIAPLLQVFSRVLPLNILIAFNPQERLSEMPVTNFYRYVLESELQFTPDGKLEPGPMAVFANLPEEPLFTVSPDVPHAWLVEPVTALHDLDNINLASVEHGVHGDYELEHVLVEGHCSDSKSSSPTPGLQFILGTREQPEVFDTIVMANLGYYQLKASPGVWEMQLRYGRSAQIYHITSHTGVSDPTSDQRILVTVDSLLGKFVVVHVSKKPGMEEENLLVDEQDKKEEANSEEEGGGLWASLFGQEDPPSTPYKMADNETIHIFSLASGHLYERFLRIMVLSVVKHTNCSVKFWFLKNFLSPSFKNFMPFYAKKYNFQYEYVQYKWPRWLHQQTQKQRIIWGYKILFLDVLFPLNVKKIIFVDADQVVRTDLKELVEYPLDGAPYGYTPFCASRKEMDGFRFWKQGYWKQHLGKRPYHIRSACTGLSSISW